MNRLSHFRTWLNQVIDVRRKAVAYLMFVLFMLSVGFQYQTNALSNARVHDVETSQHETCVNRVKTRDDVRAVLFSIVDLTDLFDPDTITPKGQAFIDNYQATRTALIEAKYPALDAADCDSPQKGA